MQIKICKNRWRCKDVKDGYEKMQMKKNEDKNNGSEKIQVEKMQIKQMYRCS